MQNAPTTNNATEIVPAPKTKLEEKQALLKELEDSKVFYDKEVKKWQAKREGAQEMMEMMFPKGKVGFENVFIQRIGSQNRIQIQGR